MKAVLEDLLRSRRLQAEAPPLRGEDRRHLRLPTGVAPVDALLGGGFPRGEVSELRGPASSGRTGLALAFVARTLREGGLAAWVDPADRLDPTAVVATGCPLDRLLWLRGGPRLHDRRPLATCLVALETLLGSGLFDVVILDGADAGSALRRQPTATWLRLARRIEETPTAFVVLAAEPLVPGFRGARLALEAGSPRWSEPPGPGRLLRGIDTAARAGRYAEHRGAFALRL